MAGTHQRIWALAAILLLLCTPLVFGEAVNRRQLREWTRLLKSEDPQKRSSAATSLLAADDDSALKALLDALASDQPESGRISVITAFGVKGDDRATAQIIAALDDNSDPVRQAATAALTSITTARSVKLLEQSAGDPKRPLQLRVQTVSILGEMRAMDAIPGLIGLLSDKEESVRASARTALERITLRTFDAAERWVDWWKHSSTLSRDEMLEELVNLQSDRLRIMAALIEKLQIQRVMERKDRNDPAQLIDILSESDSPKVKILVIKELREVKELRGKAAVDALVKVLGDTEAPVRQAAAEALGQQGDPAAGAALVKVLEDPVTSVRVAAATALGLLKVRDAVPALCLRLSDPSPEAAIAAASAVGEIADPAALDSLVRVLGLTGPSPALHEAMAKALARLNDPRALPTLLRLVGSPSENLRWTAVDGLGGFRWPPNEPLAGVRVKDVIAALQPVALKDANPQIREAALATLAKIGDPAGFDTMVDALSDEQKRVSDQALRSLLQVADSDRALYGLSLERLVATRRYALAEQVLAQATERLGRTSTNAADILALRGRLAGALLTAKEWALARPHLDTLVEKAPKEVKYQKDLIACLYGLPDADALLARVGAMRRALPDQAEYCWQETVKAVELLSTAGDAAKVIGVVDTLEKENPELGGPISAARLRELRTKARNKTTAGTAPADAGVWPLEVGSGKVP